MADSLLTTADFIADALDVDQTTTSEVLNAATFMAVMPMTDTADGSENHKYTKYITAPTVGFRAQNTGRDLSKSADEVVTVTCQILDWSWQVDQANLPAWRRGEENLIMREGMRHLGAAMFKAETQAFYGTTALGDAAGFAGLIENSFYDALADEMVVDAGGTTTADKTSVWAIRSGFNDCRFVSPSTDALTIGETVSIKAVDGSSMSYPAWYTPGTMFVAFQQGGKYSAGRICNIDGTNTLTDDLLSQLLAKFPAGSPPTYFVMNRASLQQLQQSRTATNQTGAPAPFPGEAFGVPIITTDALVSTEAAVT